MDPLQNTERRGLCTVQHPQIIAALIYLVSPVDLIPDVIPILGYVDEVFVLSAVAAVVADEIRKFREWERR